MIKVAIIPARGGSKRIFKKNIRNFLGKPMISYPIENLLSTKFFDKIFVTTDDLEIAQVVRNHKELEIILRPAELSDDITPTVPVIRHAVSSVKSTHKYQDSFAVCCVYPTNPFLSMQDVQLGYELLLNNESANYINPICKYPYPIQRALSYSAVGEINMLNPELKLTRSQDLEVCYHDAGQWYWGMDSTWLSEEPLLLKSRGIIIPKWRVQDIDDLEDWESAEKLYSAIKNEDK